MSCTAAVRTYVEYSYYQVSYYTLGTYQDAINILHATTPQVAYSLGQVFCRGHLVVQQVPPNGTACLNINIWMPTVYSIYSDFAGAAVLAVFTSSLIEKEIEIDIEIEIEIEIKIDRDRD